MLGLGVVKIWGNHFRHNSHQTAIIILVILCFACVYILILYYNHVYIVLQLFWWVGVKFGSMKQFW